MNASWVLGWFFFPLLNMQVVLKIHSITVASVRPAQTARLMSLVFLYVTKYFVSVPSPTVLRFICFT